MIYPLMIILFGFCSSCFAMQNPNFADVTLEGMNNFACAYSVMSLTNNSYQTLKARLKELNVSKNSQELIAVQFYVVEQIKETRSIKRLLTLVNLRMHGVESPCLPHITHVTSPEFVQRIPTSNCTFTIVTQG